MKRQRIRRAVVILALLAGCDAAPPTIGANTADLIQGTACGDDGWWQSAVAVLMEVERGVGETATVERQLVCSAVMVAPDVVLSAAHCLHPELLAPQRGEATSVSYWVSHEPQLSGWDTASPLPDDATAVRSFEIHPEFDPNLSDGVADLALLQLSAARSQAVATLLPESIIVLTEGIEMHGVGWGLSAMPSLWGPPPIETRGARLCGSTALHALEPTELQVGWCGIRKCYGDSGGPTFIRFDEPDSRYTLVSISSRDHNSGGCARGGTETRVDAYEQWLTEATARLSGHALRFDDHRGTWPVLAAPESAVCVDTAPHLRVVSPPPDAGGCTSVRPVPILPVLALAALWARRRNRDSTEKAATSRLRISGFAGNTFGGWLGSSR